MKAKFIYCLVALLAFGAAGATTGRTSSIKVVYIAQDNGDYRLYLFGSDRKLVCEEKPIQVVSQGDAVNPVVIECKH
jgi:hypothetical protein